MTRRGGPLPDLCGKPSPTRRDEAAPTEGGRTRCPRFQGGEPTGDGTDGTERDPSEEWVAFLVEVGPERSQCWGRSSAP